MTNRNAADRLAREAAEAWRAEDYELAKFLALQANTRALLAVADRSEQGRRSAGEAAEGVESAVRRGIWK